jgi:diadenosine tetraphosphatase ApaH/serine/threonine PP2A family protein phosphatase
LPVRFEYKNGDYISRLSIPPINEVTELAPRAILNPGSVGQPRDRDPRAAFTIFDPDENTWHYQRVGYDIASVQEKMTEAGLPERHIQRLQGGW